MPEVLTRADAPDLAYVFTPGDGPVVVFLGGFRSDMTGTKALALEAWAKQAGRGFLRLDYSGHGASQGRFEEGTIGLWLTDALAVLDAVTDGPLVLVGSSMGGWIACLVALARPQQVVGLTGIAAAPDFTERLMWDRFSDSERWRILNLGRIEEPSAYSDTPTVITKQLIEEGRRHLLLHGPIPIPCPVRLIHGQADPDVPWSMSLDLADRLDSPDVQVTLVKGGDHRLSTPADLALITRTVAALTG